MTTAKEKKFIKIANPNEIYCKKSDYIAVQWHYATYNIKQNGISTSRLHQDPRRECKFYPLIIGNLLTRVVSTKTQPISRKAYLNYLSIVYYKKTQKNGNTINIMKILRIV